MTEKKTASAEDENPFGAFLPKTASDKDAVEEEAVEEEPVKKAPTKRAPAKRTPAKKAEEPEEAEDSVPDSEPKGTKEEPAKELDLSKLPVVVLQGDLQGSISLQNGRPVLKVAPRSWIGEEPLILAESQITDLVKLLQDLLKDSR